MIWHILKYLISYTIPAYFRKIQIKNLQYLKNNLPAIICSNHPNAFMDPIAFSYMVYPPRVGYMARGDAFKPGLISAILQSIGIVPIYRMQDAGAEGVKKNNESYKAVYNLLKRNKKIMIFAEGICVQEKRLRPIKKGVPRLIFNAQQIISEKKILVIPVCMNYSNPSKTGGTLFINVGEPFTVTNRMQEFAENPNASMNKLIQELYQKMYALTVHIDNPVNDDVFEKTREVLLEPICNQKQYHSENLEQVFEVEKEISEVINIASLKFPEMFEAFSEKIGWLYDSIQRYDIHIPSLHFKDKNKFTLFLISVIFAIIYIFYSAIYTMSSAFLYLPYYLSHKLAKKIAASKEFYASFFLAFSTFISLFYFLILFLILKNFFSPFIILLFFVITLSCIPLIHRYKTFRKKFITLLKILKNKTFALNLSKNLEQILSEYDKLKKLYQE